MLGSNRSLRVVSLVPSATETLRAWGVEPVACTRFCEQPDLPTVGGTKDPDVAAIAALAPDLVVVDREENRREDHAALVDAGLAVHVLHVVDLAGLDEQMAALAEAVDRTWAPLGPPPEPPARARAWVPIWRRPWMALGEPTYGSAVLRALGIANVAAGDGPYPELDLAAVAERAARPRGGAERALPLRRAAPGRAGGRRTDPARRRAGPAVVGSPHAPAPSSAWPRSSPSLGLVSPRCAFRAAFAISSSTCELSLAPCGHPA